MERGSTPDAPDPFDALAADVRRRWAKAGFGTDCFCEVASEALDQAELHRLGKTALLNLAIARIDRGAHRACFHGADNVVPIFADDKFIMTFHLWRHTFGNPHSHEWNGAFQNLTDPVVYADYAFETTWRLNHDLEIGRLTQERLSVLQPGAIVSVERDRSVHGFGHTGLPGLTVAVRSRDAYGHTYDYWGDALRVTNGATDEVDEGATLRARLLTNLRSVLEADFEVRLVESVRAGGLRENVLLALRLVERDPQLHTEVFAAFMKTEPAASVASSVEAALVDKARHHQALSMFEDASTPAERFLVSLLRFAPDGSRLRALVAEHAAQLGIEPSGFSAALGQVARRSGARYLTGPERLRNIAFDVLESLLEGDAHERTVEKLGALYRIENIDDVVRNMMSWLASMPVFQSVLGEVRT
ncbi:MAG: hypothetical protein RMA76_09720 [Deltaproteobacteria bacterium]